MAKCFKLILLEIISIIFDPIRQKYTLVGVFDSNSLLFITSNRRLMPHSMGKYWPCCCCCSTLRILGEILQLSYEKPIKKFPSSERYILVFVFVKLPKVICILQKVNWPE